MIRWLIRPIQKLFFKIFPDDQFATMVAHTVVTFLPALAVGISFRLLSIWEPLGVASVMSAWVAVLYWRREGRQVGEGKWGLANYSDIIGPVTVAVTFLAAWGLT